MKINDTRRKLLGGLFAASGLTLTGLPVKLLAQSAYSGKFLLTLQLDGGVDVTSFCDPKTNVAGEPEINRWARASQIRTAGNLRYAPYAGNSAFFDKYYRHLLVINGVDAQTNAHSVGIVHNWSGRNSEGFPSLTALFAAVHSPDAPMAYLNFGGYGATQGVAKATRVGELQQLREILEPNATVWSPRKNFLPEGDIARIMNLHMSRQRAALNGNAMEIAGNRNNQQAYLDALAGSDEVAALASTLPADAALQPARKLTTRVTSTLHQQVQMALLAFKAGVSVAADLYAGGFDTHQKHDTDHPILLGSATDAIDYLWTYAEELGIANRIVLLIGTDFGRTPFFNSSDGKDHWPISSTLVMEKNAAYGNRMVGKTDEGHNALKINPATLQEDTVNGVIIKPAHIHKALRAYLGLESSAITQRFAFLQTENFAFFG